MAATLLQALATVHFGDLSTDAFLNATQAGRPADAPGPLEVRSTSQERLQACLSASDGRLIWEGPIPRSDKPGRFIVINPYDVTKLTHKDPEELETGKGLTADTIAEVSGIFVEVDEALDGGRLAIEEQARIYDRVEADTGLRFSTAVLSGDHRESARGQLKDGEVLEVGKSLHIVIATRWQGAGPEALRLRQEATDALCAIAGADPLVRDVARKQRVGGVVARLDGRVRVQTCLRADTSAVFDLQDVRDRLVAYAEQLGINVQVRLEAMQLAFQCRQKAKAWVKAAEQGNSVSMVADEAAETLRELALSIRQEGVVRPEHIALINAIGVPKGQVAVTTQSGATRVIATGHGEGWDHETTILTHTSGQSGLAGTLWTTMRRGYRVPDVHCIGHADAHASAYLRGWRGGFSIHCPSCGTIESAPIGWASQGHTASKTVDGSAQDLYAAPEPPGLGTGKAKLYVPAPGEMEAYYAAQVAECQARADERAHKALHDPMEMAKGLHFDLLVRSDDVMDRVASERADLLAEQVMNDLSDDPVKQGIVRVIHSRVDIEYMNNPDKLDGLISLDEQLVELALTRYAEKGGECPNGPIGTRGIEGGMKIWRLPCRRRTCAVCGPRWRRAERAAIAASIATLGEGWLGASIVETDADDRQFRRWAGKDLTKRALLRVRFSPTEIVTLLLWAKGSEPSKRTADRFVRTRFVRDWADVVADKIIETVQPGPDQQAVSGTPALTEQINALRDTLLGRKKNAVADQPTFTTMGSAEALQERVNNNIQKPFHVRKVIGGSVRKGFTVDVNDAADDFGREATPAPASIVTKALEESHFFRGQAKKKTIIHYDRDGFISLVPDTDEPVRSTS